MTTVENARRVATTLTANGTLVAGKHNPVDASGGARTVTLPTAVTSGAYLSVEKRDASANSVIVSGSIRGALTTVSLVWQYESITFRYDGGTWIPTEGHKTKSSMDAAYALVVNAADPRFGTTRDQAQINAAIQYIKGLGGGRVFVPRAAGPWAIGRSITGSQKDGGLLIDAPNIALDSDGAVLNLTNNSDFIVARTNLGTQVTITADVAATDSTLTVTSSASFTVGQWTFLRLGQAAYDAFEPDFWLWAKVAAIPDGTHVTIDRVTGYAMTVASVTNVAQRSIAPIATLVENIGITGLWNLVNPATGSANAESGINLIGVRGVRIGTIVATTPGAAAVGTQFCDGVVIDQVRVPTSHAQNGQASKGRGLSFAESRGVQVGVLEIEDFEHDAVVTEGRCEGIRIEHVLVRNNYSARSASAPIFGLLGNARLSIGTAHFTGNAVYVFDTGGTAGCDITIDDLLFYTSAQSSIQDLGVVKRRFVVNGTVFSSKRKWRRKVTMAASNGTPAMTLPTGYLASLAIYVSTKTGLTSIFLGDGAGHNSQVDNNPATVAGSTIYSNQGHGFGSGYGHSFSTPKTLSIFTDATTPGGATAVIEAEYWADPNASDPRIQDLY